jgi:dihydrolipoamide dehydrogenase
MSETTFDLIVIGAGPGGYVAAIRAAQLGLKVACVEKEKTLGGTCLNIGCIPSKALLESSEHFAVAQNEFAHHGITVGKVGIDLAKMMERKNGVVSKLTGGVDGLFKKNKVTRLSGKARLQKGNGGGHAVVVEADGKSVTYTAPKVLLATGSVPAELPNLKFDGKDILSSTEALALDKVPEHLVVVGAGAIGLELGSVWRRLGSKVTVVEFADKFLSVIDQELARELQRELAKQGLEIHLSTSCTGVEKAGGKLKVSLENVASKEKTSITCDKVLVAAGRRPYSEGLGLEAVGVNVDKRGTVQINDKFETNVSGIYAIGDLVPGPMLAHKAEEEGVAAAECVAGQHGHINYATIPNVIYTWPELASVGFTEEELLQENVSYNKGTFPFVANGRALTMGEGRGKVKVLSHKESDVILGVHIVGPRASDMIAEAVAVMEFGGTAADLGHICHAHPTLSEALKEAGLAVHKRTLNL